MTPSVFSSLADRKTDGRGDHVTTARIWPLRSTGKLGQNFNCKITNRLKPALVKLLNVVSIAPHAIGSNYGVLARVQKSFAGEAKNV